MQKHWKGLENFPGKSWKLIKIEREKHKTFSQNQTLKAKDKTKKYIIFQSEQNTAELKSHFESLKILQVKILI